MADDYDKEIQQRWHDKARQAEHDAYQRMNQEANDRLKKLGEQSSDSGIRYGENGNGTSGGSSIWGWIILIIVLLYVFGH